MHVRMVLRGELIHLNNPTVSALIRQHWLTNHIWTIKELLAQSPYKTSQIDAEHKAEFCAPSENPRSFRESMCNPNAWSSERPANRVRTPK